jgi:protein-tyrosine-phosphatase
MQRIIFLCTGNTARRQLAEALQKYLGGSKVEVYSAGTKPQSEVNSFAIEVMKEKGIFAKIASI